MIPKIIHYCWFGKNEMSVLYKRCIESWQKHCPDFEIRLWNEHNSDIDNEYCRQAIKRKKWSYVTDWIRFDVLYKYGGVYLDTDIEIIKPIDSIINNNYLIAPWEIKEKNLPGAAFIAAPPKNRIAYRACEIIQNDLITAKRFSTGPYILQKAIEKNLESDYKIIDSKYLYPFNPCDTNNEMNAGQLMFSDIEPQTLAIHHFTGSWVKHSLIHRIQSKIFPNKWPVRPISLSS